MELKLTAGMYASCTHTGTIKRKFRQGKQARIIFGAAKQGIGAYIHELLLRCGAKFGTARGTVLRIAPLAAHAAPATPAVKPSPLARRYRQPHHHHRVAIVIHGGRRDRRHH